MRLAAILVVVAGAASAEPRVAIDPGHGGKQDGAIGPGGLQEKEATLQIAKRLAAMGFSVALTNR